MQRAYVRTVPPYIRCVTGTYAVLRAGVSSLLTARLFFVLSRATHGCAWGTPLRDIGYGYGPSETLQGTLYCLRIVPVCHVLENRATEPIPRAMLHCAYGATIRGRCCIDPASYAGEYRSANHTPGALCCAPGKVGYRARAHYHSRGTVC